MFTITITGHRPKYFKYPDVEQDVFINKLETFVDLLQEVVKDDIGLNCGGAHGVDTWAGIFCGRKEIPFDLYVPFPTDIHTKGWSYHQKLALREQRERCTNYIVVCETYHTTGYQKRNVAMVDNGKCVVGYYLNGVRSGSRNCVRYAIDKKVPVFNLMNWNGEESDEGLKKFFEVLRNQR